MSTSSGQKRLLPKPPNFDIFQNDRNEAAKLQRLMPVSQPQRRRQPKKQNEQERSNADRGLREIQTRMRVCRPIFVCPL